MEEFFLDLEPDRGKEGERESGFREKLRRQPMVSVWRNEWHFAALREGTLARVTQWLVYLILVCLVPEHAQFRMLVPVTMLQVILN